MMIGDRAIAVDHGPVNGTIPSSLQQKHQAELINAKG
jgi:hypothetical protein